MQSRISDTHQLRSSLQFRYITNQSLLITCLLTHDPRFEIPVTQSTWPRFEHTGGTRVRIVTNEHGGSATQQELRGWGSQWNEQWNSPNPRQFEQGRHFNFFLVGAKIFFSFQSQRTMEKLEKQHFICSNLTLFIIPFFLSFFFSFFSLFLFFLFFSFFFSFFFSLGGGATAPHPAPLKWRPWLFEPWAERICYFSARLRTAHAYWRTL